MLDLNAKHNVAEITQHGTTHEFYYRTPLTDDVVGFQAEGLQRKGGKIINRLVQARIKFGALVLIGFKTGTIGFDGKAISSDPADKKNYRKDWKELLVQAAPQLVGAVGMAAFEGVSMGGQAQEMEIVSDLPEAAASTGASVPGGSGGSDEAPLAKG